MFTLPQLPYAYNALEPFIDETTMHIHHEKHHAAYITNLNDALKDNPELQKLTLEQLMVQLPKVPEMIRTKVRNNAGGHLNHSFFWTLMQKPEGQKPTGSLFKRINESFGDVIAFQTAWEKAALGRFGSGWVWLVLENGKLKIEDSANQDNPWMLGSTPILGLDVWEHAYYLKYQNKRADYVKAWWNVVDWESVSTNYSKLI